MLFVSPRFCGLTTREASRFLYFETSSHRSNMVSYSLYEYEKKIYIYIIRIILSTSSMQNEINDSLSL